MPPIPDELLYEHAERVRNKVVFITGAATGIGKVTATRFAAHGAHVIIADMNLPAAEQTARELRASGGRIFALKCDVTIWEDVLAAYEFAIEKFGVVDIVIANAGIGESAMLGGDLEVDSDGKFVKPSTKTVDVNLIGVLYTVHLAQHYLLINCHDQTSLKAVVILGSIASWWALRAAQYTATKFAVLGLMRSLDPSFTEKGIRIAAIHPWFADTDIVPYSYKLGMAGIPLVPVPRVAGAIFYAASSPDPSTSGSSYWCHPGPVFRIPREEFKLGVYKMIDEQANAMFDLKDATAIQLTLKTWQDLAKLYWRPAWNKVMLFGTLGVVLAWRYRKLLNIS